MKIKQETWPIRKLVAAKSLINLEPTWQRGPAWKPARQVLLIDSILRGMDIPKVYLRKLPANSPFRHDAVDGQQRIRAIWEFRAGNLSLDYPEPLPSIEGLPVQGKAFAHLDKRLRDRFEHFDVSVAEITSASNDEITNLFARLQMGVSLNPAELRNAILGPVRHVIDSMAKSHEFFLESRIPDLRYKRQDYVTHVFAIAAYKGSRNIKAPDLKKMVAEYRPDKTDEVLRIAATVGDALTVLAKVDERLGHSLTQKWLFVDLCWLIMQQQAKGVEVDAVELADNFHEFDALRRKYASHPESLIRGSATSRKQGRSNQLLYDYIVAFRAQGATHANIKIRNVSLRAFCL
jgi:hypothetical protein